MVSKHSQVANWDTKIACTLRCYNRSTLTPPQLHDWILRRPCTPTIYHPPSKTHTQDCSNPQFMGVRWGCCATSSSSNKPHNGGMADCNNCIIDSMMETNMLLNKIRFDWTHTTKLHEVSFNVTP